MLAALEAGEADGVIMHKIDRSARNLRDWSDLGELIDRGIAVHFAHESVDLNSRGGRLSADIQAVSLPTTSAISATKVRKASSAASSRAFIHFPLRSAT